jgi:hypothetical protein
VTAFKYQRIGQVVLEHMADTQRDPFHKRFKNFEQLSKALDRIWAGDIAGSISILRDLDTEEVIRFAREGLEAEKALIEKAQQDAQASITAIRKRLQTKLRRQSRKSNSTEIKEAKITETEQTVPESTMPETTTIHPVITSVMLRAEVAKMSPRSEGFLNAVGAFAPTPTDADAVISVIPIRGLINVWAQKTLETLIKNMKVEPIGYLHLERLQFTPMGYELGELVYSLPMLPAETVRLTHREWSRTETEYSKLVAAEIETASEETLSEKSELTQSSSTQQQHSSAYNASVSAGYSGSGFNISASFGYNCNDSETSSRQFASKQAQDITKKATSRAKKDSKITFKVTTAYELEEQSFREFKNELGRTIRYDFHRLMKKWRIDLYRYDVRLTYDIVIPEPGSYLLRKYERLAEIAKELSRGNPFVDFPSNITRDNYPQKEKQWGISLPPPPLPINYVPFTTTEPLPVALSEGTGYSKTGFLPLEVPEGYYISDVQSTWKSLQGYGDMLLSEQAQMSLIKNMTNSQSLRRFLWAYTATWQSGAKQGDPLSFAVTVEVKLSKRAEEQWQRECFDLLSNAAKAQWENRQQQLKVEANQLLEELNREDALMLRKIEKEELMKGVLRWLLGPTFEFYPQDTLKLPDLKLDDKSNLEFYDPITQSVKAEYWQPTLQYGEMVKFLHQAIEWENVNYVLYPYFWTFPEKDRWDFKQSLYHKDYVHRSFLRAGAARVVLTIRRGFEKAFLSYMEGSLTALLGSTHPYMTAAEELEAMANTKYPYTQDANVEKEEYVFTWENIPGNETERLLYYLEHDLFINWNYLFSLPLEFSDELDNQQLSAELKEQFHKHDKDLPQQAAVEVDQIGSKWTIIKGNKPWYAIRSENAALNVYDLIDCPTPTKSADQKTIYLTKNNDLIEITMDKENGTALLKIGNGRTYDLVVRQANGQHKIYKEQNWVDTWYEFTPTGALDVEVGHMSDILTTKGGDVPE